MKRSTQIEMVYPGAVITCNHYLGRRKDGGLYVKREVAGWMLALGWLVKIEHIEDWKLPLTVKCSGRFKDKKNQPDLANLSKVILDSLEDATGINDRDMRWVDGNVTYGENPVLLITIEEAE